MAARLMLEQGMDFLPAKKKAAQQLGLQAHAALPTNQEIEQALLENQRLFGDAQARDELRELRIVALKVMDLLQEFRPRLVGDLVSGALTATSEIELHVFCDHTEQISFVMMDADVDYRLHERRLRWRSDDHVNVPAFSVVVDNVDVTVFAFDYNGERQSPLSPVDGRPMARKTLSEVSALLAEEPSDSVVDKFFG